MGKHGKPKGWENCPEMSSGVLFDRFVAFKTPYERNGNDRSFTVSSVFNNVRAKGLRIGLWFNLTDTDRYYDGSKVENYNCTYVKLKCSGRDMSALNRLVAKFISTCDVFFNERPGEVVGVHCTHGFNRTGFLIVSYMVEMFRWHPAAAVREFARLRPPGIYRKEKLKELSRKYGVALDVPPTPCWTHDSKSRTGHETVARREEGNWRKDDDGWSSVSFRRPFKYN